MYERRFADLQELRLERREDDGQVTVRGHAAVYERLSVDFGGWREVIRKGAFKPVLRDDVVALWQHDTRKPMARRGNKTLDVSEDSTGLAFNYQPNDTTYSRDANDAIERRDVNQMSFGFNVSDAKWIKKDGENIREITKMQRLWEISPVTWAAYPQTDVSLRENLRAAVWLELRGEPAIAGLIRRDADIPALQRALVSARHGLELDQAEIRELRGLSAVLVSENGSGEHAEVMFRTARRRIEEVLDSAGEGGGEEAGGESTAETPAPEARETGAPPETTGESSETDGEARETIPADADLALRRQTLELEAGALGVDLDSAGGSR